MTTDFYKLVVMMFSIIWLDGCTPIPQYRVMLQRDGESDGYTLRADNGTGKLSELRYSAWSSHLLKRLERDDIFMLDRLEDGEAPVFFDLFQNGKRYLLIQDSAGGARGPFHLRVIEFDSNGWRQLYYGPCDENPVLYDTDHDTAKFAVETIEKWWLSMGREKYEDAHSLFITADGGGSNGSRNRLWKKELQIFADKYGLNVYVSHFPPGTSKWNKIEHRMFSAISMNWRGKPLVSLEVIVNLIAATTTKTGLRINAVINKNEYKLGEKVNDKDFSELNIRYYEFHPEWNYVIMHRQL